MIGNLGKKECKQQVRKNRKSLEKTIQNLETNDIINNKENFSKRRIKWGILYY